MKPEKWQGLRLKRYNFRKDSKAIMPFDGIGVPDYEEGYLGRLGELVLATGLYYSDFMHYLNKGHMPEKDWKNYFSCRKAIVRILENRRVLLLGFHMAIRRRFGKEVSEWLLTGQGKMPAIPPLGNYNWNKRKGVISPIQIKPRFYRKRTDEPDN